jgi:Flp pilus assembly secretin CpaC
MKKFFASLLLVLPLLTASAQQPAADGVRLDQSLSFDIEVLEFNTDLGKEIDKVALERARLDRMIAEGRVRPVANLQVRAKSGDQASARLGQRVPVQASQTSQSPRQTQYESTGLTVDISPVLMSDNRIQVSLKVEFSAVVRSEGNADPAYIQRTFTDKVRVKVNERIILLSAVQHGGLWPSATASQASGNNSANVIIVLTGRVLD